ncbi:hypothetical protein [Tenacibaculum maritimum]|uniref:hypothetical protein n=1 Tax=Tenacibaculum maritimum TaxID=107401 RepID=UPI0012E5CF41|nr:hypothetical protein [Tenacibaculum maritimum]CAA0226211.1 conserved hypothetical protein [Tenacibaculum maritimum]
MKNRKEGKLFYYIILGALLLAFYGFFQSISSKNELSKNSSLTIGVIIRKYDVPKRGTYIRYKYLVKDVSYEDNQLLTLKKALVNVGDKFEVKYSNDDANNSELNFKKRIDNE